MSSNVKQVNKGADVNERLAALLSNAGAVRAVASSIEGTLGPKGLNCMLVDRFGDVTITNDGSAILSKVEAESPRRPHAHPDRQGAGRGGRRRHHDGRRPRQRAPRRGSQPGRRAESRSRR